MGGPPPTRRLTSRTPRWNDGLPNPPTTSLGLGAGRKSRLEAWKHTRDDLEAKAWADDAPCSVRFSVRTCIYCNCFSFLTSRAISPALVGPAKANKRADGSEARGHGCVMAGARRKPNRSWNGVKIYAFHAGSAPCPGLCEVETGIRRARFCSYGRRVHRDPSFSRLQGSQ
jgi:hypothetical protein